MDVSTTAWADVGAAGSVALLLLLLLCFPMLSTQWSSVAILCMANFSDSEFFAMTREDARATIVSIIVVMSSDESVRVGDTASSP